MHNDGSSLEVKMIAARAVRRGHSRAAVMLLLTALALALAGCGEQRQSIFIWDHLLGTPPGPEVDPGPETGEPDPDPGSSIDFDVERWAVITGGEPVCARASTRRDAAFMMFTDDFSDLLLEVGPGFDLRWSSPVEDGGQLRVCTSRNQGLDEVALAGFDPFQGLPQIVGFDSSGEVISLRPMINFEQSELIFPQMVIEFDEGYVATGEGVDAFGNFGQVTSVVLDAGFVGINAMRGDFSVQDVIGMATSSDYIYVAYTGEQDESAGVVVRQYPFPAFQDFPLTEIFVRDDAINFGEVGTNKNHLALTRSNKLILSSGGAIHRFDEFLNDEADFELNDGTRCATVTTIGEEVYASCTQNGVAQVRRVGEGESDTTRVVYRVAPDSRAFDLVKGQGNSLVFSWVEQDSNPPVTTIDHLVRR